MPSQLQKSLWIPPTSQKSNKMKLQSLVKQPIHDPTISVNDTKNPSNASCTIFKLKYTSKYAYRQHMKLVHKDGKNIPVRSRLRKIVNPNIQPNPNDPAFYCLPCQRNFSTGKIYHVHIGKFHPSLTLEKKRKFGNC